MFLEMLTFYFMIANVCMGIPSNTTATAIVQVTTISGGNIGNNGDRDESSAQDSQTPSWKKTTQMMHEQNSTVWKSTNDSGVGISLTTSAAIYHSDFRPAQSIQSGASTSAASYESQLNQNTTAYVGNMIDGKTPTPSYSTSKSWTYGQLGNCGPFGYCANVSGLPDRVRYCHCDDMCKAYDDCCIDANVTDILDPTLIPNMTCEKNPNRSQLNIGVYVVSQCLDKYKGMPIVESCRTGSLLTSGPWVVGSTKFVYKNHFCAECNDVFEFTPFTIKFVNLYYDIEHHYKVMNGQELFDFIINQPKTSYLMIPPTGAIPRSCVLISTEIPLSEQCFNGTINPVRVFDFDMYLFLTFKNEECLPGPRNVPPKYCLGQMLGASPNGDLYTSHPMSVMFYFQRQQHCEVEVAGFCMNPPKFKDTVYETQLYLVSSALILMSSETLNDIFYILEGILSSNSKVASLTAYLFKSSTIPYQYLYKIEIIANLRLELEIEETIATHNRSITVDFQFLSPSGNLTELTTKIHKNLSDWSSIGKKNFIPNLMPPPELLTNFPSRSFDKYLIICDLLDEDINNGLVLKDIIGEGSETNQVDYIKNVVSYTGMSISTVSLGYSVYILRQTQMHMSIPGTNLQSICVSLMVSNIVFMIGIGANDNHDLCYCVGVLLHYLWLSVFSFKSISLVYICYGFRKLFVNVSNSAFSRFAITLLGLGIPLLFVLPSIGIDVSGVFHFGIEYSGDVCFPTGFPGNIYFVSIPIGLSIIINLCCMASIWFYLKKHSFGTRSLRKSNDIHLYHVFVRISFITGAFWIFGIIGGLLENDVAQYIFIIFGSFQGLFVAIGNISTRRVRKSWEVRKGLA